MGGRLEGEPAPGTNRPEDSAAPRQSLNATLPQEAVNLGESVAQTTATSSEGGDDTAASSVNVWRVFLFMAEGLRVITLMGQTSTGSEIAIATPEPPKRRITKKPVVSRGRVV